MAPTKAAKTDIPYRFKLVGFTRGKLGRIICLIGSMDQRL